MFPADAIVEWDADLVACRNHVRADVIGRFSDGTFRIERDDVGLKVELDPDYEIVGAVRTGGFRAWSICFSASDDAWSTVNGRPLRTVRRAHLVEVSCVPTGGHHTAIHLASEARRWSGNHRDYIINSN